MNMNRYPKEDTPLLRAFKKADKGDHYVRLNSLGPFLFATSNLDQKWLKMLKSSGLLVTPNREDSLEPLTDREMDIVDTINWSLHHVLGEFIIRSPEKFNLLTEVLEMFKKAESPELTYQSLLTEASKLTLCKQFWRKMSNGGSVTDVQKFSVIYVLKQYYMYVQNSHLTDSDRQLAADTQKALPWKVKGNQSYRSGNLEEAMDHYTTAIQLSQFNHLLYGNRAQVSLKLGKYRHALSDSIRAQCLSLDWVKGYYRVAESALEMGMFSRAGMANEAGIHIWEKIGDNNLNILIDLKDQKQRIAVRQRLG